MYPAWRLLRRQSWARIRMHLGIPRFARLAVSRFEKASFLQHLGCLEINVNIRHVRVFKDALTLVW